MSYYFLTKVPGGFSEVVRRTREALQSEGFGVISEIDIQKTLKDKIGVEFRPYLILGACNPTLAHEALRLEDKVGTMLPCNVVVQETESGIEVAAIDPVASMQAIQNEQLSDKAGAVAEKLRRAILSLGGEAAVQRANEDKRRAELRRHAEDSRHEIDAIPPHGTDPLHEGP
jgi:uncharacterized protein (DUF302 family)